MLQLSLGRSNSEWLMYGLGFGSGIVATMLLHNWLPDYEYLMRTYCIDWQVILESHFHKKQRPSLLPSGQDTSRLTFDQPARVLANWIDHNGHVNNAKYVYELNFSRRYFFQKLGIRQYLTSNDHNLIVQAQTIRYRKELVWGQALFIRSTIVDWNDKERSFFVETKFLDEKKQFVLAIHLVKYKVVRVGKTDIPVDKNQFLPSQILKDLGVIAPEFQHSDSNSSYQTLQIQGDDTYQPTVIGLWEASNFISSMELNPNKNKK